MLFSSVSFDVVYNFLTAVYIYRPYTVQAAEGLVKVITETTG